MSAFRFLSIASRRYSAEPAERAPAVRMILINAMRLARLHLGDKEAAQTVLNVLHEEGRDRACS